jgi:hypothetical protein
MRRAIAITAAAIAVVMPVGAQESGDDVVIADTVDFGITVAVYVDAPRHLRLDMQKAVALAVSSRTLKCVSSTCSWAAQPDQIRYFSGLSGAGTSVRSGLACPRDWGVPKQRFYRVDTLESRVGCLELSWDDDHKEYDVFEAQNGA